MSKAFSLKTAEILKLEDDLGRVAERAIPYATRNTINKAAFVGMRIAKSRIKKQLTLRNRWTVGSIRVRTTKELSVSRQMAILGSTEGYMEDQEFGAVKKRKGKEGVPIPTGYASGEGESPRPRKKLPRGKNVIRRGDKSGKIVLSRKRTIAKNKKQKTFLRVREAIKTGNRYIYLDTGRTKGIFRVLGGTKKNPQNATIKMVYSLEHPFVTVPKDPWLHPSVERVRPHIPRIYIKSLKYQLNRLNLLK